ncbi:MAG: radical SAM protein [Proteobacteria bacterium]|nr:radical SAM protein [Pseudomonadota bacterium]
MDFFKLSNAGNAQEYFGVNWALTTKCNYRCSYCHPDLYNGKIKTAEFEVITQFVDKVFDYCGKKELKPFFEFAGGEVTYLKWFGDLLDYISQRGGLVAIISNASSSLEWWNNHIHSLHGACLSFHVEGVKSVEHFIQVAKIAEQCRTTNLHVNVMMPPERFDECLKFAEELRSRVETTIALQPLYHGFGGAGITGKYAYTVEQEEIMKTFRGRFSNKALPEPRGAVAITMDSGEVLIKSTFDLLVEEKTNFVGWECHAGLENIVVTFKGDIYRAWCMQDGPIGTIFDLELELPSAPVICRTKICQCGPDISSRKMKRNIPQLVAV